MRSTGRLAAFERYLQELSTGNAKKVGVTAALFFEPRLVVRRSCGGHPR